LLSSTVETPVNILFLTSELAPYAKTGGLADVSAALPKALTQRGHDVRPFMPLYSRIDSRKHSMRRVESIPPLTIQVGAHRYEATVFASRVPGSGAHDVFFVHCPVLFARPSLYTQDADEHLRFIVLMYAALHACQRMGFSPHILHSNDWQTALAPLILQCRFQWDRQRFGHTKSLLTIHNLMYQGRFGPQAVADAGLADSAHLFHQDQLHAGQVNFLLHGILYANAINTVSPTYAAQIRYPELGAGLDPFLNMRGPAVVGILNGIDPHEWNPQTDVHIAQRYGPDSLQLKEVNKRALLGRLRLGYAPEVPVVGIVSRLAGQKGFDLLEPALGHLMARHRFQLVVLGSGERRFERLFFEAMRRWPSRVHFYNGFSNELAHQIEAGADLFLMPSRYEPCGLNQMYSLAYGTVPVVHKTGGLADTVRPWNRRTGQGTGFVFEHADAAGLVWAMESAFDAYRDSRGWKQLMLNGMAQDFSWQHQVTRYEALYQQL
jgi:starch synthase